MHIAARRSGIEIRRKEEWDCVMDGNPSWEVSRRSAL
jgi:hypothetical protein